MIVFGDAMFGAKNTVHLKGKQVGLVNVLWRQLKKREKLGELVAIKIDEYLTSQASGIGGSHWGKMH